MPHTQKMIEEYTPEYCHFLEATYGEGMMSEGGLDAIDDMFSGLDLADKQVLDIGFGLGAAALHLADQYHAIVKGVELNPWLVEQATQRTPAHLKDRAEFLQYDLALPFENESLDLVYSRGVFVHIHDKKPLFSEIKRVLKPGGKLLIYDWLSPIHDQWGARLQKMCEMENLTLYAQTQEDYLQLLKTVGFADIKVTDKTQQHAQYNQDIADRLAQPDIATGFTQEFGAQPWRDAIEAYQLISDSMKDRELLAYWFAAIKPGNSA